MPLIPGDTVHDRYRVQDLEAQGGMSAVYRAWDMRLEVSCALKELVPYPGMDERAQNQLRDQFLQEAQVLAELRHPNMPRVTDHFEYEGGVYLVMDFVEGRRLDEIIEEEGAIQVDRMLKWAQELVEALGYCHQKGILHRDVKPQNVIIAPDGSVKLVDFGLAKLLDIDDRRTRTVMRGLGTPEYAPPEQYDAEPGSTDERSDIYSLGATIYHALTGTPPPTATQRIVDPGLLKPVGHYVENINPHIDDAILQSLSLQPSQRFRTVDKMAEELFGHPAVKPASEPLEGGARRGRDAAPTVVLSHLRQMPPVYLWASAGGGLLIVLTILIVLSGNLPLGATAAPTLTATPTLAPPTATPSLTPTLTGTSTPQPTVITTPTDSASSTPTSTTQPSATSTSTPSATETATPSRTPTPDLTQTSQIACVFDVTLVGIRDPFGLSGYWFPNAVANFELVLQNSGTCPWPENTQLVLVSANDYAWPESWEVGTVGPGESVTIPIQLRAPGEPDVYRIVWQIELPDGERLSTEIARNLRVATPTPTATRPLPTPTLTPTRRPPAATATSTITPRPTFTPTPTDTPTPSLTPSITPTPTFTPRARGTSPP
jgi:serine/threonine protein kinase